ncbi:homoaconitase large subunit [bacterium BMS3Bbin06]|nr:homoaconitase large subunit [bacterium BMS3Abin08]GBE33640.1 homoaconitase large subunit [bacterium BMS3Bbin06]HDO35005.1 aconitate hydratase [Nitrospirota bacterium]HDY70086.1 aconitate hydratase [Nitrospirota bacterium]
MNIVEKIFSSHLVYGELRAGKPVGLKIDEVYTQDATGTMTWLQFEAMCIDRVRVPLAVSYIDHNMIQSNYMNPDDHIFLQSAAARFGAWFSKPGNGICHQVNLERFARPGWIGLGTDSHTPTNGGMGMIAIGVGGLDAATVMAGNPFELTMPEVILVRLKGKLRRPYVTAMDIILELLRRLSVKGGVGRIFEYGGEGAKDLNVTERATITNMGAELGATTSVFPSDENTRRFLNAQGRDAHWMEIVADEDAGYTDVTEIDLDALEPLVAQPHSPDAVVPIKELAGTEVHQVCIGSCTNSSYQAMRTVAAILMGRRVAEHVNLHINPGSKQVYEMIARDGSLADMIAAGARMLESSCGPCIGMGGAPATGHVSVRTYNRNFRGRCGNKDAYVYLASPVSAAVMAVTGEMEAPGESSIEAVLFEEPREYMINDNQLIPPSDKPAAEEIVKGPNIKEVPVKGPFADAVHAEVLIKLGDNITTDDIMPAGSAVLPFRSNIPAISQYVFYNIDSSFSERALKAKAKGGGIIVGAENYGQGSSREHAAIAPMYLGLQVVIAKSFARIHRSNLINFGILPLLFDESSGFDRVKQGDHLRIDNIQDIIGGEQRYLVENVTTGERFICISNLNDRERNIIKSGGLLSYARRLCSSRD